MSLKRTIILVEFLYQDLLLEDKITNNNLVNIK